MAIGGQLAAYIAQVAPPGDVDPLFQPMLDAIIQYATLLQSDPRSVCRTPLSSATLFTAILENIAIGLDLSQQTEIAAALRQMAFYISESFPYYPRCSSDCTALRRLAIVQVGNALNLFASVLQIIASFLPPEPPYSALGTLVTQITVFGNALAAERCCCVPPAVSEALTALGTVLGLFSFSPVAQVFVVSAPIVLFAVNSLRLVPLVDDVSRHSRHCEALSLTAAAQALVAATVAFQASGILTAPIPTRRAQVIPPLVFARFRKLQPK